LPVTVYGLDDGTGNGEGEIPGGAGDETGDGDVGAPDPHPMHISDATPIAMRLKCIAVI